MEYLEEWQTERMGTYHKCPNRKLKWCLKIM